MIDLKTAVVGCGNISRVHFAALEAIDGITITSVCDIRKDRADSKASKYNAKAYYDFDEMLQNEELDCIHICTPHYLHTQMAVKALRKGINVLIEKPCSVTAEETDLLRRVQTETGKQVGVCFQNRYNESSIRAKEICESGRFGKILAIRAFVTWERGSDYYSDDWHGTLEKECGGVLINQAIHTVDLVQYLGEGCSNISAHIFNDHLKNVIEVEDTAAVLMNFRSGAKGILYATTAYGEDSEVMVEVCFENGKIRLEGEKLYILSDSSIEEICRKSDMEFAGKSYWGHGHSSLIADYYDCLQSGRRFAIDAYEGGKAANIVAASYKSSKENSIIEV